MQRKKTNTIQFKKLEKFPKRALPNAGCIMAPLPAVLVSTGEGLDEEGIFQNPNLACFAWTGIINSKPPMLSISCRKERYTYQSIVKTKEFVVNLVHEDLLPACDFAGVRSRRSIDKFKHCKLSPQPAKGLSKAPAIAESLLNLSCRLRQELDLGSHVMFIADIVAVEAAEKLFDEQGSLDLSKASLISYVHGKYHSLGPALGFFGYSLASPKVLKRRLKF